jgi:hypothetical protein
VLDVGHGIA